VNTIRKRLADGSVKTFYYHRPTGERLPGAPGDPEFLNAYVKATAARSRHHDGTLSALIHAWSLSPKWTDPPPPVGGGYAETTRREYRRMLVAIERRFGDLPIDALEDSAVRQDFLRWRAKVASESGAREADHRLAVLSALLSWAKEDAGEIGQRHFGQLPRPDAASCRGRDCPFPERKDNTFCKPPANQATEAPKGRPQVIDNIGDPGTIRTCDPQIRNLAEPHDFIEYSCKPDGSRALEYQGLMGPVANRHSGARTGPPWPPDPRKGSRRPVGGPDGDGIKETALATAVLPQRRWHVNRCLLVEAVRP